MVSFVLGIAKPSDSAEPHIACATLQTISRLIWKLLLQSPSPPLSPPLLLSSSPDCVPLSFYLLLNLESILIAMYSARNSRVETAPCRAHDYRWQNDAGVCKNQMIYDATCRSTSCVASEGDKFAHNKAYCRARYLNNFVAIGKLHETFSHS